MSSTPSGDGQKDPVLETHLTNNFVRIFFFLVPRPKFMKGEKWKNLSGVMKAKSLGISLNRIAAAIALLLLCGAFAFVFYLACPVLIKWARAAEQSIHIPGSSESDGVPVGSVSLKEYEEALRAKEVAEQSLMAAIPRGDGLKDEANVLADHNAKLLDSVTRLQADAKTPHYVIVRPEQQKQEQPPASIVIQEPLLPLAPPEPIRIPSGLIPVTVYGSSNEYEYGSGVRSRPFCVSEEIKQGKVLVSRRKGLMMEIETGISLRKNDVPTVVAVPVESDVIVVPRGAKKVRFYYEDTDSSDPAPLKVRVME